jgi:hypothetical protein
MNRVEPGFRGWPKRYSLYRALPCDRIGQLQCCTDVWEAPVSMTFSLRRLRLEEGWQAEGGKCHEGEIIRCSLG